MKESVLETIKSWVGALQSRGSSYGANYVNAEIVEIGEDDKFFYFKVKVPKVEEKEVLP